LTFLDLYCYKDDLAAEMVRRMGPDVKSHSAYGYKREESPRAVAERSTGLPDRSAAVPERFASPADRSLAAPEDSETAPDCSNGPADDSGASPECSGGPVECSAGVSEPP
jgi:hypothetical protein